jgi:hypothetical protein
MAHPQKVPKGYVVIFRPFITLRNGKRLYAWEKGLKAWRLVVPVNRAL